MKNLPLSLQIWLVFAVITLCICIMLWVLLPRTLRDFFTKEVYATIENAQVLMLDRFADELFRDSIETNGSTDKRPPLQDIRTVNHLLVLKDSQAVISPRTPFPHLPEEILREITTSTKDQRVSSQRYSSQVGGNKIFYVAAQGHVLGREVLLVSYMWDSYREDLVKTLFSKLATIMGLAFIFSWVPSLGLARYLTGPLVTLEKRVEKLADRDWQEPIQLQREDEIGRLGKSVEKLRQQMLFQEEAQQSLLQNVSHELKTPVMVIQSYVQAIKDGIFPKGDLAQTLHVIEEESHRLQKLINNLLYLTKLDYMSTRKSAKEHIELGELIKDVVEKLRWQRKELDWSLKISSVSILGDIDQWRVVLENLLDNQIRYAKTQILISLTLVENDQRKALLHIYNDGPIMEEEIIKTLFSEYNKGKQGKSGLGLAIVHRILSMNGGTIRAKNEEVGVSFYLDISLQPELLC